MRLIPDSEIAKFAAIGLLAEFNFLHPCGRRPLTAPVNKGIDRRFIAFELPLHRAVRLVPDPARDAQMQGSLHSALTEGDPLDAAADDYRDTLVHRFYPPPFKRQVTT
jgi:hypothetical protein